MSALIAIIVHAGSIAGYGHRREYQQYRRKFGAKATLSPDAFEVMAKEETNLLFLRALAREAVEMDKRNKAFRAEAYS